MTALPDTLSGPDPLPPAVPLRRSVLGTAGLGLLTYCLSAFNIAPERIWAWIARLGGGLALMFLPCIRDNCSDWLEKMEGLDGTLSMAFFGTGLAAVIAFPFCTGLSHAIESTSSKRVESFTASGGLPLQPIRYAVVPQVNPMIPCNLESKVRSGTIVGAACAGGIGLLSPGRETAYWWRWAWSVILTMIAVIKLIDWPGAKLIGYWEGAQ